MKTGVFGLPPPLRLSICFIAILSLMILLATAAIAKIQRGVDIAVNTPYAVTTLLGSTDGTTTNYMDEIVGVTDAASSLGGTALTNQLGDVSERNPLEINATNPVAVDTDAQYRSMSIEQQAASGIIPGEAMSGGPWEFITDRADTNKIGTAYNVGVVDTGYPLAKVFAWDGLVPYINNNIIDNATRIGTGGNLVVIWFTDEYDLVANCMMCIETTTADAYAPQFSSNDIFFQRPNFIGMAPGDLLSWAATTYMDAMENSQKATATRRLGEFSGVGLGG